MKEFKLNLQLFTTHTNVTTDVREEGQSYPTYNDLSAEMKTFYDMTLIEEAGPNLVHDQFGQERPIPSGRGKTIEFRKFTALPKALTPLTEGVTPDGGRIDVTAITATVSQYGYFVEMSDMLELTALDPMLVETVKLLGKQAGQTLDTISRNALNAGTNVSFCTKVSGSTETAVTQRTGLDTTAKIKVKDIQKVVAKLRGQNAPTFEGGKYVGIIHPYVAYDLMRDPEWIDAHKYAQPRELYAGEIGEIAGVRFVESTEAKIWNDSTCPSATTGYYSVFSTLILGRNAYGKTAITGGGLETIINQLGSAGSADPLKQRATAGWKATKVTEILIPNYIVRLESCSPDFAQTAAN